MSLTGISSPSLPLSTPLQPWDMRHTISSEQSLTILLRALTIIHWSSLPSLHSILMTSHPVVCRACSRSSASATAPCLPAELKRISAYLLLFFCLCGMMYWELWGDNCCICSTVRDSVSVILCISISRSIIRKYEGQVSAVALWCRFKRCGKGYIRAEMVQCVQP